jgi:Protein of unknown function (DUF2934)
MEKPAPSGFGANSMTIIRAAAPDLNANPRSLKIVQGSAGEAVVDKLRRSISERAYQLFQEGGSAPGHEAENWLAAEREVLRRVDEVRESGPWAIVNLELLHTPPDGVSVIVEEQRAIIAVEEPQVARKPAAQTPASIVSYFCAEWPASVDPATASAYVKSGVLTLEAKMRPPSKEKSA